MTPRPLSPYQRRVWLLEQAQPGTPANLLSAAAVTDAARDPARWRAVLGAVVSRHETLHSFYGVFDGQPGRAAADAGQAGPPVLNVPVLDLRYLPLRERDEALRQVRERQARASFDLARELPVRALLVMLPGAAVLIVTVHRIALGESALGVLLRELLSGGRPGRATDAGEANRPAGKGASPGDIGYWRTVLRDLPAATLPADRRRQPVLWHPARAVPLSLPAAAAAGEADVLLAAFQALLVRLGSDADIAVTVTVGDAPAVEDAADRAVIRTDLSDDPDFGTLRARVRSGLAAASARPVPFDLLAGELAADDPRGDPFAPVALVVRDGPVAPEPLPPVPDAPAGIHHELRLVLAPEAGGGFGGGLEYAADLFEPVTAERIAARYGILLGAAAAEPGRPISTLPLLTEGERDQILGEANAAGGIWYPGDRCLHEMIAAQARLSPEAPAVIRGARTLTYGELDREADRLARALGPVARPGRLVAICMRRSPGTIIAILGVLKTGAAYVPLDPANPRERLAFMLADSDACAVLTDSQSLPRLGGHGGPVLILDEAPAAPGGTLLPDLPDLTGRQDRDGAPGRPAGPDDPCYVIYTSGSTGKPKGAINSHRGVINTMTALISRIRLDSGARLLQTSSLSFDMSAFEILATLLAGACLVIPETAEAEDPGRLLALVRRREVTVWSSAPPLFSAVLDEALADAGFPGHLAVFVVGGDRFPPAACALVHDLLPDCRVFNVAGMTEVSFTTTAYRVLAADGQRPGVPWGMPLPNQRMYVLDAAGGLAPRGAPGELYIGGDGVGLGYWNRPDLTAQRFLPDPYRDAPGARMYRTGDLVRHLPDGNIEFLGRLDHQVKVRGFRIELGEVETVLAGHPAVRAAVAGVRAEESGADQRLVAYLTFRAAPAASVEDLRAFLGARLPDYMVPSTFVELPRIPLLPSGKTDRRALDAIPLPAARPHLATGYVPPRDGLERMIAEQWSQVLAVDKVGADDDFVALGGHSMLATAAMSSLARQLGVDLSARDLLEASTPAQLAARVRELAPGREW